MEDEPNKLGILFRPSNITSLLTYQVFEITSSVSFDDKKIEANCIKMDVTFSATIPLDKSCIYAEFTRFHDKIILQCDDESVMLFNIEQVCLFKVKCLNY